MANDPHALLARLLHRIAPEVDLDDIDGAEPLQDAADLDSMDFLNLISALYAETGIEIPERDYSKVASIDGFVAYVQAAKGSSLGDVEPDALARSGRDG
jgi:acyl carrier protein